MAKKHPPLQYDQLVNYNPVTLEEAKRLKMFGYSEVSYAYYVDADIPHVQRGMRFGDEPMNHNNFDDFIYSAPSKNDANLMVLLKTTEPVWKIYKYILDLRNGSTIPLEMPIGSEILHLDDQFNEITMWVKVNTNTPKNETRIFKIYGTGDRLNPDHKYLGTVKTLKGEFIWHVFEVT